MDQLLILIDNLFQQIASSEDIYLQIGLVAGALILAPLLATLVRRRFTVFTTEPEAKHKIRYTLHQLGDLMSPLLAVLLLKIAADLTPGLDQNNWLLVAAITLLVVYAYFRGVRSLISNKLVSRLMLIIGIPLLTLQSVGALPIVIAPLEAIALNIGNIRISLLGLLRVAIFGSFVFWLGRVSNNTGQEAIRRQKKLDHRTREVAAKLFEIGVYVVVFLLLLQIMGVNLTALAVFGGAVGVGIGFGLQSISSNFISGLIILLDRSLGVGDFIELEDGRRGYVTALNMRSTTLETFEGKDIVVPNESFISTSFVNWTRKDPKQRYRVDFSVAYGSDIRKLVDVIKAAVAEHPQVLSGEDYPIEERPDCEIDSFGDSGVNMFVEFWIEDIDDGKNRVGGDLLLTIYETMQEHGFTIPFPQREVRILNDDHEAQADKTQKVQVDRAG
jgi:small-conductance mechanosensitive channel